MRRSLYLDRNRLSSLDEDSVDWVSMTSLQLAGNPWHCDCRIAWMRTVEDERFDSLVIV